MIGPSSQISKLLLTLLLLLLCFYLFMDLNLYLRLRNYPPNAEGGNTSYAHSAWLSCQLNPLCIVTVKACLLDHTNLYLFAPTVQLADDVFAISSASWITPNAISLSHIAVAALAARGVASDGLASRRLGVALFELRTWLDDLDGHVARARRHILGERSEVGSTGYYVDGVCDAVGVAALLVGVAVFLRNHPSRRGYAQLPTVEGKEAGHGPRVVGLVGGFALQLVVSSVAWNRYIALYQELLEGPGVGQGRQQGEVFCSLFFFVVAWLWRVCNVHSLTHLLLLSIFCDKLWEFLRGVQFVGYGVLFFVVFVTEVNLVDVKDFLNHR